MRTPISGPSGRNLIRMPNEGWLTRGTFEQSIRCGEVRFWVAWRGVEASPGVVHLEWAPSDRGWGTSGRVTCRHRCAQMSAYE